MLDLVGIFRDLTPPEADSSVLRFVALPVPGFERHHLGKDAQGAPALLVSVDNSPGYRWPAPIVLEHLTVQHDLDCRVSRLEGMSVAGRFTVVRCASTDPALHTYFLQVSSAVVALLGQVPTYRDVTAAIDSLTELFRAVTLPPRKSIQGLWAELFLIARAHYPQPLVRAWHTLPTDCYDFSDGTQRIEVKSAAGRIRQHHFTLDQVSPVPGTQVLIGSLLVERVGAGLSVMDLAAEIRSRLGDAPGLTLHLDRVVSATLGESLRYASEEHFDRELAERTLLFFAPDMIPKVNPVLPAEVSDVRFRVDLSNAPSIDLKDYRSLDGIFACALCRPRA